MVAAIGEYIRNLAVFMLFMTMVGIVIPKGNYKTYIDLIMGFVLIFIMISPIYNFINRGAFDEAMEFFENIADMENIQELQLRQGFYEDAQMELIAHNVRAGLSLQLEELIISEGFTPTSINFVLSQDSESFLEILDIYINITESQQRGLIRIERISIGETPFTNVENPRTLELKNLISDVYNLSVDNIHIKVTEN